ncbi:MAG TPA: 3-oxo-tetronate 4-phosphate decarboxylase [Gaiellaceae bacterium]|nr:3-oxo-tetronate 4-phosphate decarboxylase [Gaiellaceae bacterium]
MNETELREAIAAHGRSLFARGLSPGTSGNISVRSGDGFLMTPTGAPFGALDPARLSRLDAAGEHVDGDPPTKERPLHLAIYEEHPGARAIVHLHSTHAVAVACLDDVDPEDVLPPLTPYYAMRVGRLPLVEYARPGDPALAEAVRLRARESHALLLANHGPIVAGPSLDAAASAVEEIEETAKLALLLRGMPVRLLTPAQLAELGQPR